METITPKRRALARRAGRQDPLNRPVPPTRPQRRRPSSDGRLTRLDWINAGQDVLRDDGVSGLKLAHLTKRLGVSTGSFYHHFGDFDEFLGALAEHYSVERVQGELELTLQGAPGPVARMRRLARLSVRQRTFELDHAMRIWATMDPRAAHAVRRAEALVLAFLADAFVELGFSPSEGKLRARILLSCNVAPLGLSEGDERREFFKDCLRLLSGRRDLDETVAVASGQTGACTSAAGRERRR